MLSVDGSLNKLSYKFKREKLLFSWTKENMALNLFELMLNVPVNSEWSCRNAAFILWDFYPKLERHDIQNVLRI